MNLRQRIYSFLFATLLAWVFVVFSSLQNRAYGSHAMGLDLTYQCLDGDTFAIQLAFYRDCDGIDAPGFDGEDLPEVDIISTSCGESISIELEFFSVSELTAVCDGLNTTCGDPSSPYPGIEEYIYRDTVVLPDQCDDWVFSYGLCCRNADIVTIEDPDDQEIYVETTLDNLNFACNSSPSFSNPPIPFSCVNAPYCFNNGATDIDGDSLAFKLVTPTTGPGDADTVEYLGGYSTEYPINATPALTLDEVTGDICLTPTVIDEITVIQVRAEEWRGGSMLSTIDRDIQIRPVNCVVPNETPTVDGIDGTGIFTATICAGDTFAFYTQSGDDNADQDVTMTWNSGIADATFDISAGTRPRGEFSWLPELADVSATPHCFTVTVQDNNCPFIATQTYSFCLTVTGFMEVDVVPQAVSCNGDCDGEVTAVITGGTGPFDYLWDDDNNSTTSTVTGLCPDVYSVTVSDAAGCTPDATDSILEPDIITLDFDSVPTSCNGDCDGQAIVTATGGNGGYGYLWDDPATQGAATATLLCMGTYNVTVDDVNDCEATGSIEVTQPDVLSASITDSAMVTCRELSNGNTTVTPTGGTAPYTYLWPTSAGSQTDSTAINLPDGSYVVTVTDAEDCTVEVEATITEPDFIAIDDLSITTDFNGSDISCNGDCDGALSLTISGGSAPYDYLWSDASSQTSATPSGLCAGTFTVTITDDEGCDTTASITITPPTSVSPSIQSNNSVDCFGNSTGSATIEASGGTGAYTYLWDAAAGNQAGATASNLSAGDYVATVSDANLCTAAITVTISEPTALSIDDISVSSDYNGLDVSCEGDCDGAASLTVSGGSAPYDYLWDDPATQTTNNITGLCAGTVNVTVTDDEGCEQTTSISLDDPDPVAAAIASTDSASCAGLSNGSATVTGSGGSGAYTYLWDAAANNQSDDTAENLGQGNYTVTVTDQNNCQATATATIQQPNFLDAANIAVISNFNGADISCDGLCDGEAQVLPTGGSAPYSYNWSGGTNPTSNTIIDLCDGTYTVTVSDVYGCDTIASITLNDPTVLSLNEQSNNSVDCFGNSTGSATIEASGGTGAYTYLWDAAAGNQAGATASNLSAGDYVATVSDANLCTAAITVTISEPTALSIDDIAVSSDYNGLDVSCEGDCDGAAIVTVSGGSAPYDYLWDDPATQTTNNITGLCAGMVNVTVTDDEGCEQTTSISLDDPDPVDATISSTDSASCAGLSNGSATVTGSGGSGSFTYLWDAAANNQNDDTAENLGQGNYTVTVTDQNNCQATATATIQQPNFLDAANIGVSSNYNGANISCAGSCDGRAFVLPTGGSAPYSYNWSGGTNPTSNVISDLCDGTYTVTVSDIYGCDTVVSIDVVAPDPLIISIDGSIEPTCFGFTDGEATTTTSGGLPSYAYIWSANGQTSSSATGLDAGIHSVTVADLNNCKSTTQLDLGQPDELLPLDAEVISDFNGADLTCASACDGRLSVSQSGGTAPYTYIWSDDADQTGSTANNLCAGDYTVTITDAQDCFTSTTITLTDPPILAPTISNVDSAKCRQASDGAITVAPEGGTPPYSYTWDDNAANQATSQATNLKAGTYAVTVYDANDCPSVLSAEVLQPDLLIVSSIEKSSDYNGRDVSCTDACDGSAQAIVSGGTPPYAYTWSNGQSVQQATDLCLGEYHITVADTYGCDTTSSIEINNPPVLALDITDAVDISCRLFEDGSATVTPEGGTPPYTYLWDSNANNQTDSTATALAAGTYFVTVFDANNCADTVGTTLTEPFLLRLSIDQIDASCFGLSDGSINVTPEEGTAPYKFLWSTASNSSSITGLSAGEYALTLTDAQNCVIDTTIQVNQPDTLLAEAGTDTIVCIDLITTLSASQTGGNQTFEYLWSDAEQTTSSIGVSPEQTTTYKVTITDELGCSDADSVIVYIMDLESDTLELITGRDICQNQLTTVTAYHNGEFGPYTYTWSHPIGDQVGPYNVSPLSTTQYGVTVTDVCDHAISDTATIVVDPYPVIELNDTLADGCYPLEVILINEAANQIGTTTIWSTGDGAIDTTALMVHTYNEPGTYYVGATLISPHVGCVTVRTPAPVVMVREHPNSTPRAEPPTVDNCATPEASFSAESSTAVSWAWEISDGSLYLHETFDHQFADTGTYVLTLTVLNEFGCATTDTLLFEVTPCDELKVPTGFTPNPDHSNDGYYTQGDLSNDVFRPKLEYVDEYHLMIFNRWGELIFESFDVNQGWDGYYRGQLCQQDAYVWRLDVVFINGKELSETGSITLIR